jgi:twitching motility protein PilT
MEITELLSFAKNHKASDIHLSSGHPPILRVHGELSPLRVAKLSSDDVISMLHSIMTERQRMEYEEHLDLDFAVDFGTNNRFRVNAFNTMNGPGVVLRSVPTEVTTLDELYAPHIIEELTSLSKGLILVTGPTGSGKSTTVAAMIHHINKHSAKHILTIEDPVEFVHKSMKSLINQREIGLHSTSFARALKSAMREDPDIILVGELRDLETIHLALTAAETGHLVIATLHTSSAAQTVDRVIDVFPSEDKAMIRTMLSNSLEAVISQRLLRKTDGNGRIAAFEVLIATPAIRNLIREGKIPQIYSLMQVGSKAGMCVIKDSIYALMNAGTISHESAKLALNVADDSTKTSASGF